MESDKQDKNWGVMISDVERTLAKTLQAAIEREKTCPSAASDDIVLSSVFEQLERFHQRSAKLREKAELATQTVNGVDRTWKKNELLLRNHLDRVDNLSDALRRFVDSPAASGDV